MVIELPGQVDLRAGMKKWHPSSFGTASALTILERVLAAGDVQTDVLMAAYTPWSQEAPLLLPHVTYNPVDFAGYKAWNLYCM